MEIVIALLSMFAALMFGKNWLLARKIKKLNEEANSNAINNHLLEVSARQLKIKNAVDNTPLDELVKRKRDGDGDNSQGG